MPLLSVAIGVVDAHGVPSIVGHSEDTRAPIEVTFRPGTDTVHDDDDCDTVLNTVRYTA